MGLVASASVARVRLGPTTSPEMWLDPTPRRRLPAAASPPPRLRISLTASQWSGSGGAGGAGGAGAGPGAGGGGAAVRWKGYRAATNLRAVAGPGAGPGAGPVESASVARVLRPDLGPRVSCVPPKLMLVA